MAKNKDKNDKKKKKDDDNKDDEKYKKKKNNNIFTIIKHFIKLIIQLIIFMYASASLVFLIKEYPLEDLNKLYPTKCDDLPYGTNDSNPCMKTGLEDIVFQENKFIDMNKLKSTLNTNPFESSIQKGRDSVDMSATEKSSTEIKKGGGILDDNTKYNEEFTGCDIDDCEKCSVEYVNKKNFEIPSCNANRDKSKIPMPWKFHSKSLSRKIFSIFFRYINWLVASFAKTEIGINKHVKSIICKIRKNPFIPCSFLIILSFIIFKFLLIIAIFYYLIKLFIVQFQQLFNYGWWGLFLILSVPLISFLGSMLRIIVFIVFLFFKSLLGTLSQKENITAIHNIVYNNKMIIGYLLGAVFVSTLFKVNMDENYGKTVKTIVLVSYILILFMRIFRHLPGLIFKALVALVSCVF